MGVVEKPHLSKRGLFAYPIFSYRLAEELRAIRRLHRGRKYKVVGRLSMFNRSRLEADTCALRTRPPGADWTAQPTVSQTDLYDELLAFLIPSSQSLQVMSGSIMLVALTIQ
jgi:hypothetical protein